MFNKSFKKILIIFGTRPEAIKLLPLVRELKQYSSLFETTVCVTAQHRSMLDQVLQIFKIIPDFDLNIMTNNQSLSDLTQKILKGLELVFDKIEPDYLVIQGDTTTTFAASLLAFYHKIKILHVEAGLRTDNKFSPYPEEINRRLTSQLSDYHFVPTSRAMNNLLNEGFDANKIILTGNTGIDALLYTIKSIDFKNTIIEGLQNFDWSKKLILVTGHRRENIGCGIKNICKALKEIALANPEINIVYPVHLNPNVRKVVFNMLSNQHNIYLVDPVQYKQFVFLMHKSFFILTDSGGIQEEAPCLGKPVLIMRDTTERPEVIDSGAGLLVGTKVENIVNAVDTLLKNQKIYKRMASPRNIYGDGSSSKIIGNYIIKNLI